MKIYSVYDPEFAEFGKVLKGYDTKELMSAMDAIALPDEGVSYEPWIDLLRNVLSLVSLRQTSQAVCR